MSNLTPEKTAKLNISISIKDNELFLKTFYKENSKFWSIESLQNPTKHLWKKRNTILTQILS